MKTIQITLSLLLAMAAITPLRAQIGTFTYQGRLNLNGAPANGYYDFMFRLLNDPSNGVAAPVIPIALAVPVSNGLFTTGMDFGAENFDGANRWLEINVRTNGGGPFTTLSPRQLLTPAPYAIASHTASNLLGALPAGQISGTILNASLPASPNFPGTVTANNFSGNGAGVTDVNAATLGGLNSSNFWKTAGNAGTAAGTHFLGTTDKQPLELRVNNQRGLRLEPEGTNSVNVIGGWAANSVLPGVWGGTISGGGAGNYFGNTFSNRVEGDFGTLAGGAGNTIQFAATSASIGGGYNNTIQTNAWYSTISGGNGNTIRPFAMHGTIGGGLANTVAAHRATIGGGDGNTIQTEAGHSTIGGGEDNAVQAGWATIGGGLGNYIDTNSRRSTISGGESNRIGYGVNTAAIGGGRQNMIQSNSSHTVIGGGFFNTIQPVAEYSSVGGGTENAVGAEATYSTISGGGHNAIQDSAYVSTISGGVNNTIQTNAFHSTIGGGAANSILIGAAASVVAGGDANVIGTNAGGAAIGGGTFNLAYGTYSTVPGGWRNNAAQHYSMASGAGAHAVHSNSFVWSDCILAQTNIQGVPFTIPLPFVTTATNEFAVRATGGVRFVSGVDINGAPVAGVSLAAGSGSWTSMSDRNAKENFRATDAREVLEKVVGLPVQTWNYKSQDAGIRHIGPMAQDFKSAFGVGESDTGIATVDADGVALAAIQGLNQKLEETRAENADLKQRLTKLEQAIHKLGIEELQP